MTRPAVTLRVLHTCGGVDHIAPLTLTPVRLNSGSTRYEGVRCDGTEIHILDFETEPGEVER